MFDQSGIFYDAMYVVGFALMMVWNLKDHNRYGIQKRDAVLTTVYTYICGIIGAMLMGFIYTKVNAALGYEETSMVAIFGAVVFTPFLLLLFPIKHRQWKSIMDMLAPGILLILTCAKLGCFVNGCCRGMICDFGIHYPGSDYKNFPVQILEVATMLLVLLFTQLYVRKAKNFVAGTAYPITFAAYSVTRFCWEFFRYYPEDGMRHLICGLTFWQFVCCVTLSVCVVIIIVLKSTAQKEAKRTETSS